jgi:hypothetical protein
LTQDGPPTTANLNNPSVADENLIEKKPKIQFSNTDQNVAPNLPSKKPAVGFSDSEA